MINNYWDREVELMREQELIDELNKSKPHCNHNFKNCHSSIIEIYQKCEYCGLIIKGE